MAVTGFISHSPVALREITDAKTAREATALPGIPRKKSRNERKTINNHIGSGMHDDDRLHKR